MRTAAVLVILVAAGAGVPSHAFSAPTTCFPPNANTISETGTARVFAMSGSGSANVYGCLYRVSRPSRLVRPFEVEFGVDFQKIVIADPYVGFGFTLSEANEGSVGWVRVLNLTTGTRTRNEAAADHFFSDVNDIELTPAGSVAWIARAYAVTQDVGKGSGCQPRKRSKFYCDYPYEVRKADDHRSVLLDRGVRVDPESLRLNGQRITWLHDGALRSATLKGNLPLTGFPVGLIVFGGLLLLLAGAMVRTRSGFS